MRRVATVLAVVASLLVLPTAGAIAGGGSTPPPFPIMVVNPAIGAIILMDPHEAAGDPGNFQGDVTSTAKQASISLRSGTITTQASFKILPTFPLFHGCDLSLTNLRFLFSSANAASLRDWVPPLILES